MAKASRGKKYQRGRARTRARRAPRRSGASVWTVAVAAVVVLGVVAIVLQKSSNSAAGTVHPVIGDHWHAFLGVDVCGTWMPPAPAFESDHGIHSHGDGLIHMHPYDSTATGKNATVGKFLSDNTAADWQLSSTGFKLWGQNGDVNGKQYTNGDTCPAANGKPAEAGRVVWTLNGKVQTGDPAKERPRNGDIIAIGFLPKGQTPPEPPGAHQALANIQDLGGASATTAPAGQAPATVATATSAPATTAPATTATTAKP